MFDFIKNIYCFFFTLTILLLLYTVINITRPSIRAHKRALTRCRGGRMYRQDIEISAPVQVIGHSITGRHLLSGTRLDNNESSSNRHYIEYNSECVVNWFTYVTNLFYW